MRMMIVVVLAAQLMVFAATRRCSGAPAEPLPPDVEAGIRERIENGSSIGIVVAVVSPDGTAYHAFGHAIKGGDKPPDEKTIFEIGSITKAFTGVLLQQLVAEGKVKADDPIDKYLPPSVKTPQFDGKPVTLGSLVTHTSGLPRLPDNMDPKDPQDPYADYAAREMYAFLGNCTIEREIGSKYEYSNLGMGLLGHLLARAAGQSYERLVVERIAWPLGMADTRINLNAAQKARFAEGYSDGREVPPWSLGCLEGAGALRSTAQDMAAFIKACMGAGDEKLAGILQATYQDQQPTESDDLRIAFGWHVFNRYSAEIIWHNGGTGGHRSWCGFRPDRKLGAVVLSNSTHGIDDIGLHLLEPQWELQKTPKLVKLSPEVLERYVGYYELLPGVVLHVTREGDQLLARLSGQERFPVHAESERKFFYRVVDAQLTFTLNEEGQVDAVILHQGGRDQRLRRLPPDWEPPKRVEVDVPPAVLESYVGQYSLAPGAVFDITMRDGSLFARLTGQPSFQIYPESETRFFYKVVDAQLTFLKDGDRNVTGLILHQSGIEQRAAKTK